ncbi:nitric oxide synthase, inducible [Rhinatrema bivittatum]|uniref:nitric oxide synthase, inducible n=1 Tax=Rhinatrema bivittatum TaxID=194408 RepID=UPI00112CF6E0|nr:nitric oxide synthase, inducible [Rhinatrema bivittatum]
MKRGAGRGKKGAKKSEWCCCTEQGVKGEKEEDAGGGEMLDRGLERRDAGHYGQGGKEGGMQALADELNSGQSFAEGSLLLCQCDRERGVIAAAKASEMICPWKFLLHSGTWKETFKTQQSKDFNNNLQQNPLKAHSSLAQEDAKPHIGNEKKATMAHLVAPAQDSPDYVRPVSKVPACPRYLKIRNYENGTILQDTLHHKAKEALGCKSKVCHGSIMNPKGLLKEPRDGPALPDEVLPQAIDFINQYYNSFKEQKIEEHLSRIEAVTKEIEITGTYQLNEGELIYATKQAWRNAPRCIGRIQWSNLQVFDARKSTTAKEMFEHICRHLRYATNNGNIRSAITVFPQRTDGKHDFRVWNSQLIRYAGYQMPDGSILGDPASVEFTQLCIELGWRPKNGRFDILPLLLQADGKDPELFEIPPDLVLEVSMEHPKYEWFKELDLKWFALPAVSNMLLEVGGLEFPACPFNGWYMGTEIGVRDFCDVQRYNILEEIGRRMGLETHRLASLWKDRAVVEINIAVLHSFQKHNVTIMDHHSAVESFMKHMQNEYRLRGGCPADWVWLVPPMSGSITPVFHQEMLNYVLTPFYYYQIDPWRTHVWQDKHCRAKKKEIKFNVLAKAVLFASVLLRKSMAARPKATVLYATETGKSETLAKKLCALFNCAFSTKILCMDEYKFSDLEKETLLLVVTSTFGNGDCPGNGEKFKKSLVTLKELKNTFRYAVFGLGSSMYPQFCAFAHTVDQKLGQLGAVPITVTGEGDELGGQEEAFLTWAVHTFKIACKVFDVRGKDSIHLPTSYTLHETWNPKAYRIVNETRCLDLCKALANIHSKNVVPMKVMFRQNLHSLKSSRATILVKLFCDNKQDAQYLPGEHVGVFPGNQPDLVNDIITHLKDAPPNHQNIRLETFSEQGNYWAAEKKLPPCSLFQALTYFLDLTTPPTQLLLKKLSLLATEESDRNRLQTLCHSSKEYSKWKSFNSPTILEVLQQFPSIEVSATFLLTQLPALKPRYYSISSSPDVNPGEIHLTVAVVNYKTKGGQGPLHHGVCSTWLNTIKLNEMVPCFVRSANNFRLPENPSKPCILIGPGTGISPFRSFWQQRLHDAEKKGIKSPGMILLFGCRRSDVDHIYKEETKEMKMRGVLKEVYTAYSREPGKPKTYVQDLLRNELEADVHQILHKDEGHLYVCGDVRMARDVAKTLKEMAVKKLKLTEDQVEDYFLQLKSQMRYHEDIFGAAYKLDERSMQ